MKKKVIAIFLVIVVAILGLAFKDNLIRTYVALCHEDLEAYAVQFLGGNERTSGKYGVWKTSCYPDSGMVEFHTGGWGLAPSATYKGFYYSANNTHQLFSAAYEDKVSMEIDGTMQPGPMGQIIMEYPFELQRIGFGSRHPSKNLTVN